MPVQGNRYTSDANDPDSFGNRGVLVTPGSAELYNIRGVVCGSAGNITVVPVSNSDTETVTFTGVPAGFIPPFRVRKVTAATATVYTIEG